MKLQKINKVQEGHFITRYDLTYETSEGKEKVYEMISRSPHMLTPRQVQGEKSDAVVLIIHDEKKEKILLNREFRMAVNREVYNFPAGLIDPGETPLVSAKRELWEETGLTLCKVEDVIDKSYGATGFSNEINTVVVGCATGEFAPSTSAEEEIQAAWYTKEEVRVLLRKEYFAARTQAYCYRWACDEEYCSRPWAVIEDIGEADFGCEEHQGGPRARVVLRKNDGQKIVCEMEESTLSLYQLDKGDTVTEGQKHLFANSL